MVWEPASCFGMANRVSVRHNGEVVDKHALQRDVRGPDGPVVTTRVLIPHRSTYPDPIRLRPGDELLVADPAEAPHSEWSGWLWCTDPSGRRGWVPEQFLRLDGSRATACCDYDATELTVAAGEALVPGREVNGWTWCTNRQGDSGWVPSANLSPLAGTDLPPGRNRLYLVRHGENRANLTKEFSHRLVDYSLTDKGRLQARQTAGHLQGEGIDEIYTSPLKRAVETASILGARLGLEPVIVEAFREINVGDLERQPPSAGAWARHNRVLEAWLAGRRDTPMPGGEDQHSLWNRFSAALVKILAGKEGHKIGVVGHGGLFLYTLSDLCPEADVAAAVRAASGNCSISEVLVELRNGRPVGRLCTWGAVDHLSGPAAELVPGTPDERTFPGQA